MDVFALVSFFIMGTATLGSLSLLVCLVVLEHDPDRWRPAAVPAKPCRRRSGSMGRHAPRAPRKAVLPSSRKSKCGSGLA
jgi:hypothetical protein